MFPAGLSPLLTAVAMPGIDSFAPSCCFWLVAESSPAPSCREALLWLLGEGFKRSQERR